jgi:hypothetical protein
LNADKATGPCHIGLCLVKEALMAICFWGMSLHLTSASPQQNTAEFFIMAASEKRAPNTDRQRRHLLPESEQYSK